MIHHRLRSYLLGGALALCAMGSIHALHAQEKATKSGNPLFSLDPAVRYGVLPNGLKYYIRSNEKPASMVEFRLIVNAGSLQEDDDQLGLAHFLEHMAFNGTKHFPKHKLIEFLESKGMQFGAHLNAYTDFGVTGYVLTIPRESEQNLDSVMLILEDWAHNITLDSAEIEAERGVVLSEWRQRLGAGSRVEDAHMANTFQGSRYPIRNPIGKPEIIQTAPREALQRFYRDWYRPDLMAVVVVGPVDVDLMEARIKKHFSGLRNPSNPRPRQVERLPIRDESIVSIVSDPENNSRTLSIAFRDTVISNNTVQGYRAILVRSLVDAMLNQRLFELSRRPDAPFFSASVGWVGLTQSETARIFNIPLRDTNYLGATNALLDEVARAAQHGFLASELAREKTKILRNMEKVYLERTEIPSGAYASIYMDHFMSGKPAPDIIAEITHLRKTLNGITLKDVNREASVIFPTRGRVVTITTPVRKPGEAPPPTGEQFLAAVDAAKGRSLAPYIDAGSTLPILTKLPTPGQIVSEKEYADLGMTEWTLSNGARVLLKPTTFRTEDILLTATSPGGLYMLQDSDIVAGELINALVGQSGYGNLSAEDLMRRAVGKTVDLRKSVSLGTESMIGRTILRDAETFFQVIYAMWTQPRYDSALIASKLRDIRQSLTVRNVDPMRAFRDTVSRTTIQNSSRHPVLTPELIDQVDPKRVMQLYRERFGAANDFTFIFVGAFKPADLKPFVTRYIGGLPSGQTEQVPDRGVRYPPGIVKKTVYAGNDPKANSLITFHGPCRPNTTKEQLVSEIVQLNILGDIAKQRLLRRLREELGGTYGVAVQGSIGINPRCGFSFASEFVTDPDRRDEMTKAFFEVMDELRTTLPSEEEVGRARATLLFGNAASQQSNENWIQAISQHIEIGWPLETLWDESVIRAATPESVLDAAKYYFSRENYMHFVLAPESTKGK